ncbi:hypothetical protein PsYK624_118980 [Phanerochaete sordida]|uniref:Uncharacterized protein n=1 Tax=Phanerochaete sordida TaxID=48140 RepID=A0A9P3LJ02_9APHY|nr:hypothetical protein PsYK624_118980 [Phanerochaete sordida]
MLLTTVLLLLTFTLLAQAAPASPPHPTPTPAAGLNNQSGALSSLSSGAPDDEAVRQATCGKHGCAGFKKDKRDVAALGGVGFDGGSGSFDLAPELTGPIEGLRQQDDGIFFNGAFPEVASSGEVSTTGVVASGEVSPAIF